MQVTIVINGDTDGDIEQALDEVRKLIGEGNTTGFNSNESGSFHFKSDGEYKDECLSRCMPILHLDSDGCLIHNDGDAETDMENRNACDLS